MRELGCPGAVILAKAGIHVGLPWIPAVAGMTDRG